MNQRLCLKIAGRIDAALQQQLGQGIDLGRMLAEPLYARDVLLVCDALAEPLTGPGAPAAGALPDLPALARAYRDALREPAPAPVVAAAAADSGADSSGFNPSRFLNSIFDALGVAPAVPPPPGASRASQRGFSRWRGR